MKKTILLPLLTALTLCLAACGARESAPAETAAPAPAVQATEAPSAPVAEAAPETAPEEAEVPALDEAAYAAAQDCVGRSVEELYAAVGEPGSAQYAASCLEEDADDGMLFYEGFYVWTVRSETDETVHAVYLNE